MTSMRMYEYAKEVITKYKSITPEDQIQPDVLWVGGVLEIRRAIVWLGETLYMVTYNINNETTVVDTYSMTKSEQIDE